MISYIFGFSWGLNFGYFGFNEFIWGFWVCPSKSNLKTQFLLGTNLWLSPKTIITKSPFFEPKKFSKFFQQHLMTYGVPDLKYGVFLLFNKK
jgi:hypothetical protein